MTRKLGIVGIHRLDLVVVRREDENMLYTAYAVFIFLGSLLTPSKLEGQVQSSIHLNYGNGLRRRV